MRNYSIFMEISTQKQIQMKIIRRSYFDLNQIQNEVFWQKSTNQHGLSNFEMQNENTKQKVSLSAANQSFTTFFLFH